MIYDYYNEKKKRGFKSSFVVAALLFLVIAASIIFTDIYLEIIQLDEIGGFSSIYKTNLLYKVIFGAASFLVIFIAITLSNIFIINNINKYLRENNLEPKKLPNILLSFAIALVGAFLTKDYFYQKALNFINSSSFGTKDPIFNSDIGYYIFQRPFLISVYEFISVLWLFVILYTAAYYIFNFMIIFNNVLTLQDLKIKRVIRHNLVNIAVFFIIKVFSYKFTREGILYSNVVDTTGASYVDFNIWLKYYDIIPFIIVLIVLVSFILIWRGMLKKAVFTIAIFPAISIFVSIIALFIQSFVVKPNEINLERPYLKYNLEKTREAYNIDKAKSHDISRMQDLTPEIVNRNSETIENIRVVDYKATIDSNAQLQSNTNFYNFNDADIINYNINGKEIPILISAREIDKNKLPEKSYVNIMYKYTHGYGIVINPINRLTSQGQVEYYLSGLRMDSVDEKLKVGEPRIYYGELTRDHVIVNAANNLNEIDYDGNSETVYGGNGGIKLNFLNKLLFSIKYGDFNMLISGYVSSQSKLLLNRAVVDRAQKAVPFISVDKDPYIVLTNDGRLKWVIDAYTTSSYYPYAQYYNNFNYIRNSVKIVVDAYDGKVKYYVLDKNDPILKTYMKTYPGVFIDGPLPDDIAQHMRYPEFLFKVQTDIMKRYHLDPSSPQNIDTFYSKQDLWDTAKYSGQVENGAIRGGEAGEKLDIEPYYNMIKLPGDIGKKEELILMRPFTPSRKDNMVSWLSVRNSIDNYGELIIFNFPKNTNIFGTYQVDAKITQIDKVSKDISLWNQSGSSVFKGNLLVIPIESSVLYVEPIYIKAMGASSIPEVREIIVGYQKGEEFRFGIGANLRDALNDLFKGVIQPPAAAPQPTETTQRPVDEKIVNELINKYDALRKQLDDLGNLINELKKK